MNNVTALKEKSFEDIIDLTSEQRQLLETEQSLFRFIGDVGASMKNFAELTSRLDLSAMHPRVGHILTNINKITDLSVQQLDALKACHADAKKLIDRHPADCVTMTGGHPKEEPANFG